MINRVEFLFIILFSYLQKLKKARLGKAAGSAVEKAKTSLPVTLK